MIKYIPLSRGLFARVDNDIYERVNRYRWHATSPIGNDCVYAARNVRTSDKTLLVLMHREIMGASPGDGMVVDHINGNTLDNRRCNLRICAQKYNIMNKPAKRSSASIYKGICWDKSRAQWIVKFSHDKKTVNLGRTTSETEAALMRDVAALRLQGQFAWLNFPREVIEAFDEALS